MSSIIDRFFISVGLKTDDVAKGMAELDNQLSSGFKSIITNCIAPLMGAISAGALFGDFIKEASEADKLSKSLGVNVETMQAWMGAAEELGVAGDEMAELFHDVNEWTSDLVHNDAGPLKEFVERGLVDGFTDAQGEMLKTEDIIMKISGAMKEIGAQEATGILRRLGVGDKEMAGLLSQGPEQLQAYIDRQKELGVYTKEDTEMARKFTETIYEVTKSFKMSLVPVMTAVTPLLAKLGQMMTKVFILIRQHSTVVKTVFAGMAVVLLASVVPSINAVKAACMALIRSPIGMFIAMFVMLGIVIEDLIGYVQGKKTAFGEFWAKLGTGEEILTKFNAIMQKVSEYTDYAVQLWNEWGGMILNVVGVLGLVWGVVLPIIKLLMMIWAGIVKVWGVLQIVWNAVQGIIILFSVLAGVGVGTVVAIIAAIAGLVAALYWVRDNWETLKATASSFGDVCSRVIDDVITAFSRFVDAVTELMSRFFNWLGASFSEKLSGFKNGLLEVIGLGGEASRLATSGKGGGNISISTDNSTKNVYPISSDNNQGIFNFPSPNISVRGAI